jgi:starch-binding outer membrane protein, SusD/RagB family
MKNSITFLLIGLLLFTGCQDFLDIRPEATVPSTGMDHSKSENIYLPISAAYASLRDGNVHAFAYIGAFEITSDNADKGSSPADNPEMLQIDQFTYTPTNGLIKGLWEGYFNVVSAANNAIQEMPLFEAAMMNETNKAYARQCAGEAKTIRAYAYFNLTRMFGKVPLIDSSMTAEQLAAQHQASTSVLYEFIEKDLQEAIAVLPASYSKDWAGRITKYTAIALKAKVHMYQNEWDSVAVLTDRIMASGQFGLLDNFREVFSVDGENSKESLFEIQSSTLGRSSGDVTYLEYAFVQGPRSNSPTNLQGWGFCTPSTNLIQFLTDRNDSIRAAATLLYRGTKTPEGDSIKSKCDNPVYNGKVYTPSALNIWNFNGYGFEHNVRILRYADVLLMYAEAWANGATGYTTSGHTGLSALNEVRKRAGLTNLGTLTMDAVWDERRAELAMEEDRFFDLVRSGRATSVLSTLGYDGTKNNVFPIPATQMQLNQHLVQNPNYN